MLTGILIVCQFPCKRKFFLNLLVVSLNCWKISVMKFGNFLGNRLRNSQIFELELGTVLVGG